MHAARAQHWGIKGGHFFTWQQASPPTEISTLVAGLRFFSSAMLALTTAASELRYARVIGRKQKVAFSYMPKLLRPLYGTGMSTQACQRRPSSSLTYCAAHLKLRPVPSNVTPPL